MEEIPSISNAAGEFENLAKLFPEDTTAKELVFMLLAVLLCGISVIPNYEFGGSFGKEFAENIAKSLESELSPTELNDIKMFCALMSAIVNDCINGCSLNDAVVKIIDKGKEFSIPGHRVKAFFGLLMLLGISGVATIPNYQFVKDTVKGWTNAKYITIQVVSGFVNGALNFRGTVALTDFVATKIFGHENREKAKKIRKGLLSALNEKLSVDKKISDEDLELLSEGTLYRDKYPVLRTCTTAFVTAGPFLYSFGAYFFSAKEAMQKIEHTDSYEQDSAIYYPLMAIACLASTVGFAVKWAFLGRANYNVTQRLFNEYLADEIIPPVSRYGLPEGFENLSCFLPAIKLFLEGIALGVGVTSLTGGFGMVQDYLFINKNTLGTNLGSILITLLAALAINYSDFRDVCVKSREEYFRFLTRLFEDIIDINKDKFGEDKDEFILKLMVIVAKITDSQILKRYGEKEEVKVKQGIVEITEEDVLLPEEPKASEAYNELINEIEAISEKAFQNFLENHGKPVPSTRSTGLSTPSSPESERLMTIQ